MAAEGGDLVSLRDEFLIRYEFKAVCIYTKLLHKQEK